MSVQVKILPNGRLSLPSDMRKRMGLQKGGAVFVEETDDGLVLRTAAQAVAHAQALARRYTEALPDAGVGSFLGDRRDESGA